MAENTENNERAASHIQRTNLRRRTTSAMPSLGSSRNERSIADSTIENAAKSTNKGVSSPRPALAQNLDHERPKSSTPYQVAFHPSRSRGPTWESFSQAGADPVQSAFVLPALRKTSRLDDSFGDLRHRASSLAGSRAKNEQKLGLSRIQKVYETKPTKSPASFGPQSGQITPVYPANPSKPAPIDENDLPKYVSAFEYAMRPYLDMSKDDDRVQRLHQQPPEEDSDSEAVSSPRILPVYNEEDNYYDSGDGSEETYDWGIPEKLLENDGFRTRIRQVQLQNYLMHCIVLQNIISQLQHTPWARETQHSTKWHYEKMCSLAYKACQIADMLESRDLKARCKYWAGRACAGIRDYQQAESYFKSALLHDVKNAKKENGDVQLRGLRPNEKADVRFLRDSCRARHADYERRREKNRHLADRKSWETGRPIEGCINAQLPPSPPWVPDRDRVMKFAQHKYDDKEGIAEEVRRLLGEGLEEEAQAQWQKGDETMRNMHRRTLSREEWRYINRDIKVSKKDVTILSPEPEQTSKSQSELHKHVLEWRGAVSPGTPDLAASDSLSRYQHSFTGEGIARDMNGYSPASIARSHSSRSRTSSRPTPQNLAEQLAGAWYDG